MSEEAATGFEPRRTDPKTFLVSGVRTLTQMVIPLVIAMVAIFRDDGAMGFAIAAFIPIVIGVLAVNFIAAYLQWLRLTYTLGAEDIRVESGILSRAARSVPFERIQDVSLEQAFVPRLFGLVQVKFETGAGGGEDISLAYLAEADAEALRETVRERRDGIDEVSQQANTEEAPEVEVAAGRPLFAMGPRRLFIFGTFEFSLAVFAVLGGLLQYADSIWEVRFWDNRWIAKVLETRLGWIAELGFVGQIIGVSAGLVGVIIIGSLTGLISTFTRDWGFTLSRSSRGFRRQRGLFTKTDVVMPSHRVQALIIGTRALRYRFGWHSLKFVSLAQDAGQSSHVVAPFAKMKEIAPIAAEAGFELPDETTQWHRASKAYRFDSAAINAVFFGIIAVALAIFAPLPLVVLPIIAGVIAILAALYSWQFKRHVLTEKQIMSATGFLSPLNQIATRLKIHSIEVTRGPIARRHGYATLHLGLAGGTFSIKGVPVERAFEVRDAVLATIATTDFSELESQKAA